MLKIVSTLLLLLWASVASAKKCSDGIADIHNLITTLYDYTNMMETQVRIQYNQFHAERLTAINGQLAFLKTLQTSFFDQTCNYMGVDEGYGIYLSANEYINVVRKNVFYAVKSSIDDLRSESLSIIHQFLLFHNDLVERIAQASKNMFSGGKTCVMGMDTEIKTFFDTTVRKLMESMRAATVTNPLTVPSIRTTQATLMNSCRLIAYYSRVYLAGVTQHSLKITNDTATNNYNTYMRGIFETVFGVGRGMAQVGLEVIAAIDNHSKTMKSNVVLMNSTFLNSERVKILGKVENVCSGM